MLISLDTTGDLVPAPVLEMMRTTPPGWCFWLRLHPIEVSLGKDATYLQLEHTVAAWREVNGHAECRAGTVPTAIRLL